MPSPLPQHERLPGAGRLIYACPQAGQSIPFPRSSPHMPQGGNPCMAASALPAAHEKTLAGLPSASTAPAVKLSFTGARGMGSPGAEGSALLS